MRRDFVGFEKLDDIFHMMVFDGVARLDIGENDGLAANIGENGRISRGGNGSVEYTRFADSEAIETNDFDR